MGVCGGVGVSTVFIFSCLGLFFEEGGDNFKGYVNGALNVGTKGVESFRGIWQ